MRRIGSREVVPKTEFPNFRDAGRSIDRPLLRIASNLQMPQGRAWASEGGLRRLICEDTGRMPGKTTVQKALDRLAKQGLVVQVWLVKGQILPDGSVCHHGTRLIWVPKNRRQRAAATRFNRDLGARRVYRNRNVGFDVRRLTAKLVAELPPSYSLHERQQREIARARALEAQWAHESIGTKSGASAAKGPSPPDDATP